MNRFFINKDHYNDIFERTAGSDDTYFCTIPSEHRAEMLDVFVNSLNEHALKDKPLEEDIVKKVVVMATESLDPFYFERFTQCIYWLRETRHLSALAAKDQ